MEPILTPEQEFIETKINGLKIAGEWIPGIKIVQSTQPIQNLFICNLGLKKYGLTENFFRHLPLHEYRKLISILKGLTLVFLKGQIHVVATSLLKSCISGMLSIRKTKR
jgi:hypothetical protein